MTDTNQLPEPELGYIQTDKSNQPAFSARQMREAMQASAQVQGEAFGYIHHFAAHDERGVLIDTTWEADGCADPLPHPTSPSMWKWTHCTPFYTTPQQAQATQAEVTDAELLDAYNSIDPCNESPQDRLIRRLRAILALQKNNFSHERVPMTDEQISLEAHNADDSDWNDLRFRSSWHEGFLEGARFAEAHHSITAQAKKETP